MQRHKWRGEGRSFGIVCCVVNESRTGSFELVSAAGVNTSFISFGENDAIFAGKLIPCATM